MNEPLLKDVRKLASLAKRLAKCREVTKYDTNDEQEAWTLAHALGDLEVSFRKFLDEQLPALASDQLEERDIYNLLLDIGEEFRHVLYHIKDPKFFRYLSEESEE